MEIVNAKLIRLYNDTFYLYDSIKNSIVEITKEDFINLSKIDNNGINLDREKMTHLVNLQRNNNVCIYPNTTVIEQPLSPFVYDYLDKRVSNCILQVTRDCNLRCSYCAYSQKNYIDRNHNSEEMSQEIAKKAIDFLQRKSSDCKEIRISFYGGEPLLNYQLIVYSVLYAKKIMPYKSIKFIITTNLTLLNKNMIEFFSKYEIKLVVSIDGPKQINDLYRRKALDGKGSFNSTYRNLMKIYERFPDYFSRCVSINAVVDPHSNISLIERFFINDKVMHNINVEYHILDDTRLNMTLGRGESFVRNYNENQLNEMIIYAANGYKTFDKKLMFSDIDDLIDVENVLSKNVKYIPEKIHHGGPCLPGHKKLFVSSNGTLYVCEKANQNSKALVIGDLESGFDYDKINAIYNIGKMTKEECKRCWAFRFCQICAMTIDDGTSLSYDLKKDQCAKQKLIAENIIKNYIVKNKFKTVLKG